MDYLPDRLREAYSLALEHSHDDFTKNAALILAPSGTVIAWGVNRFPRGIVVNHVRLQRPAKYDYILHAEQDAIASAAASGVALAGLTMVCPWAACDACARLIIQSRIERLIVHRAAMDRTPERWARLIVVAREMFAEAGVIVHEWDGTLGGAASIIDGQRWSP